jgi:hypothetical protein
LGQLVGLFGIRHDQREQVSRAANFKFGLRIPLADLDQFGIRASRLLQKVANVCNLFRHTVVVVRCGLVVWCGYEKNETGKVRLYPSVIARPWLARTSSAKDRFTKARGNIHIHGNAKLGLVVVSRLFAFE